MKLVRIANWSTGIVIDDDLIVDVSATVQRPYVGSVAAVSVLAPYFGPGAIDWAPMISSWSVVGPALRDLVELAKGGAADTTVTKRLSQLTLLPPLPSPHSRVFAMAANFPDHAARALSIIRRVTVTEEDVLRDAKNSLPSGFMVIPGTVVGQDAVIVPPKGHRLLDYEVEAAVVLAVAGEAVRVWGYTAWNDISVRDKYFDGGPPIDAGPLVWALQKNFAGGNAAGPWMVVEDDIDPANLSLRTSVNGEPRQQGSTSDMIYSFTETIAHLSSFFPLQSGDTLVSGTPAGTAVEEGIDGPYLRPGDVVEIEVGAAGTILRNVVGAF
jgi:2-keto-4-pentenoate hydratase/2-oxohepta-3-ene-1,7-dioic acid hydratase in catechol pathway